MCVFVVDSRLPEQRFVVFCVTEAAAGSTTLSPYLFLSLGRSPISADSDQTLKRSLSFYLQGGRCLLKHLQLTTCVCRECLYPPRVDQRKHYLEVEGRLVHSQPLVIVDAENRRTNA